MRRETLPLTNALQGQLTRNGRTAVWLCESVLFIPPATLNSWLRAGQAPRLYVEAIATELGCSVADLAVPTAKRIHTRMLVNKVHLDAPKVAYHVERLGLNLGELADRVGVNIATLTRWRKSGSLPADRLPALALALGVPSEELSRDYARSVMVSASTDSR